MPVIIGGLLLVGGTLFVYGAVTGKLAAMMAALVGKGKPASSGNHGAFSVLPQWIADIGLEGPGIGGAGIAQSIIGALGG